MYIKSYYRESIDVVKLKPVLKNNNLHGLDKIYHNDE